tara:strand:+ start:895 stop:1143 length:249 start_codon:yes stop_codon:yes gene_type:complete
MTFLVSRTFADVSPESAEHGDFCDTGFIYEEVEMNLSQLKREIEVFGPYDRSGNTLYQTDSHYYCLSEGITRTEALHIDLKK